MVICFKVQKININPHCFTWLIIFPGKCVSCHLTMDVNASIVLLSSSLGCAPLTSLHLPCSQKAWDLSMYILISTLFTILWKSKLEPFYWMHTTVSLLSNVYCIAFILHNIENAIFLTFCFNHAHLKFG